MKGIEWLGRHFVISTPEIKDKERLYTVIMSQTKQNKQLRKELI